MAKKREAVVQRDLFGDPIVEEESSMAVVPLDFESHAVRLLILRGEPWWVVADVARILGYRDAANAARLLKEKELRTHTVSTNAGPREHLLCSESGLYRLMARSKRPEAERFQDWLFEEVLPSIRKTGGYSLPRRDDRIGKMARKLGSDRETAKVRCDQVDANKGTHRRMFAGGGSPRDVGAWHNGGYRGQFGIEAPELREFLGIGPRRSPLDHMEVVPLAENLHAKVFAERLIAEAEKAGKPIALADQPRVLETTARDIARADLAKLGPGWGYGVVDDPRRGKVLDLVKSQLPGPRPASKPRAPMGLSARAIRELQHDQKVRRLHADD